MITIYPVDGEKAECTTCLSKQNIKEVCFHNHLTNTNQYIRQCPACLAEGKEVIERSELE